MNHVIFNMIWGIKWVDSAIIYVSMKLADYMVRNMKNTHGVRLVINIT